MAGTARVASTTRSPHPLAVGAYCKARRRLCRGYAPTSVCNRTIFLQDSIAMVVNITSDSIGAAVITHSEAENLTYPIALEGDTVQSRDFFRLEAGIP